MRKAIQFAAEKIYDGYRAVKRIWYTYLVRRKALKTGKNLRVCGKSRVNKKTILDDHVNFNGMDIVGGGAVKIGKYFHSGPECMIITQIHNYDKGEAIPYDNSYIYKETVIEDFVWFGSRVIVLCGVTIGEGAIIQAGSVVVNNIPRCAIAGGHPAKVFKYRNIEHFEKLKNEGKFN